VLIQYLQRLAITGFVICGQALVCSAAAADGVAVFLSLSEQANVAKTREQVQTALGLEVQSSQVDINGSSWVRLHSQVMSESAARALVATARERGYAAWYNGSGSSLATSSSTVAASLTETSGPLTGQPYSRGAGAYNGSSSTDSAEQRWSSEAAIVTPASGDISHLPMAETFPIIESDAN